MHRILILSDIRPLLYSEYRTLNTSLRIVLSYKFEFAGHSNDNFTPDIRLLYNILYIIFVHPFHVPSDIRSVYVRYPAGPGIKSGNAV